MNPSPQAKERFQQLAEAYEVLGDPGHRARYDAGAPPGPGPGPSHAEPGDVFRQVLEELGVDEALQRLKAVQKEAAVANQAALQGDFAPAKAFVWKHKGVAATVMLPLAVLLRFPHIIGIALRFLGVVAASMLQSPAVREMLSRWAWFQPLASSKPS